MKFVLPISIIAVILAQASQPAPVSLPWGNLTAQGVLGFVVGWLITKTLPSWQKQFVESNKSYTDSMNKAFACIDASQTRHLETQKQLDERSHQDSKELRGVLAALREHCAAANRGD